MDNKGKIGSIRELAGQLIITQTPMNQAQIARLLDQLRETRLTQISVQARHMEMTPLPPPPWANPTRRRDT